MNNPVSLGLSILDMSKIVTCEYWCDYAKPKYKDNAKLCYMDTDSLIAHVKLEDIYEDLYKDVETRFDTSNYEVKRPLPMDK